MKNRQLTEQGKAFIRRMCAGNGNSLLSGKSKFKFKDPNSKYYNINGILPFCSPPTSVSKIWTSNTKYEGTPITTNQQLGEAIINWYNKYAEIYDMDANVMAAQAQQESGFIVWNYPLTSTASGISQFVNEATFDIIISNKYQSITPLFTDVEISAITKNIVGAKFAKETYSVGTPTGKQNRPILHQNITDNPEIMIKAQFRFMKYISGLCDSLASSTLLGYSRGPSLVTKSYSESVSKVINYGINKKMKNYEEEGVDYVYKIFKSLSTNFGYEKILKMNEPFDEQRAKSIDTNIRYA